MQTRPAIPKSWPTRSRKVIGDWRIFRLQTYRRVNPRTGREGDYLVLHMPNWVNVIATTPSGDVVLIHQYRHGLDQVTLEIPGGMIEEGEDPGAAAARELAEETGFQGDEPIMLGQVHPNPAIQDNTTWTYLIPNARATIAPQLDEGEDIEVGIYPQSEIPNLMRTGVISHSLVVAAFYWLELYTRRT